MNSSVLEDYRGSLRKEKRERFTGVGWQALQVRINPLSHPQYEGPEDGQSGSVILAWSTPRARVLSLVQKQYLPDQLLVSWVRAGCRIKSMKLYPGCWWREHHPITQSDLRAAPASNTLYRYPSQLNYFQHESNNFLGFFFSPCKEELNNLISAQGCVLLPHTVFHSFIQPPNIYSTPTMHYTLLGTKNKAHQSLSLQH